MRSSGLELKGDAVAAPPSGLLRLASSGGKKERPSSRSSIKCVTASRSSISKSRALRRRRSRGCWAMRGRPNSPECEYLLGELASAEKRLAILSTLARGTVDFAAAEVSSSMMQLTRAP